MTPTREYRALRVSRLERWRNRLAVRVFDLIATPALRGQADDDVLDAARWRGHQQRRRLGFVRCEDNPPGAILAESTAQDWPESPSNMQS